MKLDEIGWTDVGVAYLGRLPMMGCMQTDVDRH